MLLVLAGRVIYFLSFDLGVRPSWNRYSHRRLVTVPCGIRWRSDGRCKIAGQPETIAIWIKKNTPASKWNGLLALLFRLVGDDGRGWLFLPLRFRGGGGGHHGNRSPETLTSWYGAFLTFIEAESSLVSLDHHGNHLGCKQMRGRNIKIHTESCRNCLFTAKKDDE